MVGTYIENKAVFTFWKKYIGAFVAYIMCLIEVNDSTYLLVSTVVSTCNQQLSQSLANPYKGKCEQNWP